MKKLPASISLRCAAVSDFNTGTELFTSEGYSFRLLSKYADGIWEARGADGQGDKLIYEDEARHYRVKI